MDMQPLYSNASPAEYYTDVNGNLAQAYTIADVESKHHIPLRLGLSLQYQLNDRLALLSGINYTYLESEFIYPLHKHLDLCLRSVLRQMCLKVILTYILGNSQ